MIALGVLTVAALILMTPLGKRKRKRPEKWEKAEIMRQLLALSEQEAGGRPMANAARTRPGVSRPNPGRPMTRPANMAIKANQKTNLPARSKAR